jgi:BirA family transcriptional regulator, biotin operon repressor / biotin---[acetyl-CoA-carboxylase] ligase
VKLPGVRRLVRLPVADSTQTVARRLADAGAPDGTLVWALRQTAGRGRLARRWDSGAGGVYATLILRPRFPPARLAELSLSLGEALAGALRGLGAATAVKPPNDVYALCPDGKARKLAGILCEASGTADRLDWVLVGFGINADNEPRLARAASLKGLRGRPAGVERTLAAALRAFGRARRAGNFL